MSCHFLLQGIFLTQRLNLCLLLGRQILYQWVTWQAQQWGWKAVNGFGICFKEIELPICITWITQVNFSGLLLLDYTQRLNQQVKNVHSALFFNSRISVNREDPKNRNPSIHVFRKLSFQLSENYLLITFEKSFKKWFLTGSGGKSVCIVEVTCVCSEHECVSWANNKFKLRSKTM